MQKSTLAKSFKTKGLSKVVVCSLTTGIDISGILKGSLATTSTDGNDTFVGTHTTMTALDTLDGGAGTDTLLYIDDSAAGTPLAVQFSNIETVAVRNLSGDAAAVGKAEVATVTFGALKAGQFITLGGETILATSDMSASQVATAALAKTYSGYADAAGADANTITLTAATVGDKTNLLLGGNGGDAINQASVLTIGTAAAHAAAANNIAYNVTINGVVVQTAAVANNSTAATQATAIANAINAHVGSSVATAAAATVQIVSGAPLSIANVGAVALAGALSAPSATTNALAPSVQTLTVAGTAIAATETITFTINGTSVTTAAVPAVPVDDDDANALVIADAINAFYGATVASVGAAGNAHIVTVNSGVVGLAIGNFTASIGTSSITQASTVTSAGFVAAGTEPSISIVDGVAAVAASTNAMTVDASAFEGVTTIMNTASTDAVTFSGMTEIATLAVEKVTAGALATTTANFDADLTNGTADAVSVSLSGNTSAGTITIGAGFETVNVSAAGTNTVAGLVTGAKTVTITGAGSLKITSTIADATKIDGSAATGKLTLTSEVNKVAITTGSAADKVTVDIADTDGREFSVATDAGNDTVVLDNFTTEAKLANDKVTIDGGAGTDTLEMKSALATSLGNLTAANYAKKGIVNFEKLTISDAVVASSDTNVERLGLNSDITLKAGVTTSATLSNVAKGGTVTFAAANAGVLTVSVKDAAVAGNTADVLNLVLAAEQTADTGYGIVAAAGVETININSTTGNDALTSFTNTLQVTATSAETINISGDMKFSLAVNATLANNFVALDTINASDNTAGVTINMTGTTAYATAVTITGTAKVDTITGGAGADVINAGAGNDTVNSSAGADVITLGAGNDVYVVLVTTGAGHSFVGVDLAAKIAATDRITDWSSANDVIDINVANLGTTFVAQSVVEAAITAAGATSLSGAITAAAAALGTSGVGAFKFDGNTYVFANDATAGTIADADFMVRLDGLHTLTADNFI